MIDDLEDLKRRVAALEERQSSRLREAVDEASAASGQVMVLMNLTETLARITAKIDRLQLSVDKLAPDA